LYIYNRKAVAQAAADWIRQRARWEFYVSLSYRNETPEGPAAHHLRAFLRAVAQSYGVHVDVAIGEEYQERGAYHHHALLAPRRSESLAGLPFLTTRRIERLWRRTHPCTGHARVVHYDPKRGAAWYVARHQNWDVFVACTRRPACRRIGCLVSPSGW
jgi:hypothetical protein